MVTAMPPAEIAITIELVRALLSEQRGDLADLDIRPLSEGWDNALFRVGADLVARLPRRQLAVPLVENEVRWLPRLAPGLPIPVPVPVFVGEPGQGYPWPWTLVPWLPGLPMRTPGDLDAPPGVADLSRFLLALHRPAPDGAPWNPHRSIPLRERNDATVERIARLADEIDSHAVTERWELSLEASPHRGEPSWIHGDLHPRNLLVKNGRISAVIDFGDLASGDPATDLSIAWMVFDSDARTELARRYVGADQATWDRAAGWALTLATAYIAFSADNPVMGEIGRMTIDRLLEDPSPASPVSG